ncbi:MAG: DUF3179 domain-containing protein [Candidatus Omnitrophica bacterium]|nr:DUF3179 domain-containing protein [Candidatus Omnitrophota bacterium]
MLIRTSFFFGGIIAVSLLFHPIAQATLNEFDISNSLVRLEEFILGGPGKDDIPALANPAFVSAADGKLKKNELVIGVSLGTVAKAYPIRIMNWHEIVNDTVRLVTPKGITEQPIAVTWCPLTKSAFVFERRVEGEMLEFGVSGMLYNNNLVMYDRTSNSLWPQLMQGAATGRYVSRRLASIPAMVVTWEMWKELHPETLVLSQKTGYLKNYRRDPYSVYHENAIVFFPLSDVDKRLPLKTPVIGISIDGVSKAYPLTLLAGTPQPIADTVADSPIRVYALSEDIAYITDAAGRLLPGVTMYWFGWNAFHKNSEIYEKP